MNYCVVTTINKPTEAIEKLYEYFVEGLIIVADKKTPANWNYKEVEPIPTNNKLYAPDNHYARKNLGYMLAIENKAAFIYDTDDDNVPNKNWRVRTENVEANESFGDGWYNVYRMFSPEFIWPRGLPLKAAKDIPVCGGKKVKISSIQQGLADGEPDVDAIYRLLSNKKVNFSTYKKSIFIQPNAWCPFNSQSTWWFPKAYPLMYLPVSASFRMTDIWRSFIAQRCLWELGEGVTFHSPAEVFQDRNEHDLQKDFEDEVPGYLNNDKIVEVLSKLKLKPGENKVRDNLFTCYDALVQNKILPPSELESVKQWVGDYEYFTSNL